MAEENQGREVKTKTKAKARYLKAKKERRKQRKPALQETGGVKGDLKSVERVHSNDDVDAGVLVQATSSAENMHVPTEERPFKRQKFDYQKKTRLLPSGDGQLSTPSLQAALPSFPLPTQPDAPSKHDLALLGLDKALVDAEIIDPSTTMRVHLDSEESSSGLTEKTRRTLSRLGITQLFAVQTALIPFLLKDRNQNRLYLPYSVPRDVCVSAPTGSGKTLAYVLPIIEMLSSRVVTQLRALVVLPTRDLVTQVRETFEAFGKGHGLKVVSITGQHSFVYEQTQLVANGTTSKADILICTPGRLMDHLNATPNFTLQHLRFLVIDEADRLLAQSFQDWLAQVLSAIRPPPRQPYLPDRKSVV